MKKKNLLKRLLVTVVISTELITTVYATDMSETVVYENQEEQTENNVVEQPAMVQPPQAMPDVMAELNATGSTSINAVDLLGDNPSINISVPNNIVTQQSTTESETTVETELIQRDLVYKRKDVTITATGMFPKDATIELGNSIKLGDTISYTTSRKIEKVVFNCDIKIKDKDSYFNPQSSIQLSFKSSLINTKTDENMSLDFVLLKDNTQGSVIKDCEIKDGSVTYTTNKLGSYALLLTENNEVTLVNKTIHGTATDGTKITINGYMPEDSTVDVKVVNSKKLEAETLEDGTEILKVLKTYDIKIKTTKGYYQPEDYGKEVKVVLRNSAIQTENNSVDDLAIVHTDEEGITEIVDKTSISRGIATFYADSFSDYSVVLTRNAIGENYVVFSSDVAFTLSAAKYWDGKLEYSIDDRNTWVEWDGSQISGTATQPIYLRGIGNSKLTSNNSSDTNFVLTGTNVECDGNIENLLDYATVARDEHPVMADYCFYGLFRNCEPLIKAPDLLAEDLSEECYCAMFAGCHNLVEIQDSLPATTLAVSCYRNMFYDCSSLTKAPELPATTLTEACYCAMFWNCSNLVDVPVLSATTMAPSCYQSMFRACISLVQPPELPATNLAYRCYYGMFYECTTLTKAPDLPADTLAEGCYSYMFWKCYALVDIPTVLPAMNLATDCYRAMFQYCNSLITPPELPATTLANGCYRAMFYSCIGLTSLPELPATTLVEYCYFSMFERCSALKVSASATDEYSHVYRIPLEGTGILEGNNQLGFMFSTTGGTFKGTPSINTNYYLPLPTSNQIHEAQQYSLKFSSDDDFILAASKGKKSWAGTMEYSIDDGCTWIEWDGSQLTGTSTQAIYIRGINNYSLTGASILSATPWKFTGKYCIGNIENLLNYNKVKEGEEFILDIACFACLCQNWQFMEIAPDLPTTSISQECYFSMFKGCKALKKAPELPATTMEYACYKEMFYGCVSLIEVPDLPATTLNYWCYQDMFYGCTSLITAPNLPAETLMRGCYKEMFYNCKALKNAPSLPATILVQECYSWMFSHCESLINAPQLPALELAENCYWGMFDSCKSLQTAPTLPAITLEGYCYGLMFENCTSLTEAPDLPATTVAYQCYVYMFQNCTSLTKLPELSAKVLQTQCYMGMFYGCTAIKVSSTQTEEYAYPYRIPQVGYGSIASDASACLDTMFASTGGTFKGTPEINTTYYVPFETELSKLDTEVEPFENALKFSSNHSFTIKANSGKTWNGTIEYTIDNGQTWVTWDGSEIASSSTYEIVFRGSGNTVITGSIDANKYWVLNGRNIKCTGNIETLLDYTTVANEEHPVMDAYCYAYLFNNGDALMTAPLLPTTTLSEGCYLRMFQYCTSLETPPRLPALVMANCCYEFMFNGCRYLQATPKLPATELAEGSYKGMFYNCVSLTTAPILSATVLANSCYQAMFYQCTSLNYIPELPATTLADNCYNCMFYGCTSLTTVPKLPATILAEKCYYSMFSGCTSLITAPELPATTLAVSCYMYMFYQCTSLIYIPELPAITLANSCYNYMFCGCTSLKVSATQTSVYKHPYRVPINGTGVTATNALGSMFTRTGGTFKSTPTINTTYYLASPTIDAINRQKYALKFSSDGNFTLKVNSGKPWDGTLEYSVDDGYTWATWDGSELSGTATKPIYIRGTENTVITHDWRYSWVMTGTNVECHGNIENLLDYQKVANGEHPLMAKNCYEAMFSSCTSLITAPELPAMTLTENCYGSMFSGCTSLTTAPELPAMTLAESCYEYMFASCTSLTIAPELPAPELVNGCYHCMFDGCTSLEIAPELPATTLAEYCYNYMFYDCNSLITAPTILPATTLAVSCYEYMFSGCTSLTTAPKLPATMLADNCYYRMFMGCESLIATPELPATKLADDCYSYMFSDCISLTVVPKLPATELTDSCYANMFYRCPSLTTVPVLPATTLAPYCYASMFDGCTALDVSDTQTDEYRYAYRLPARGVGTDATNALLDMFAETGGSFTGTPEINTTYYLTMPPIKVLDYSYYISMPATLLLSPSESENDVYVSDFTVKAKATEYGLDGQYIKVVPNATTELTNEETHEKVTLNINQKKQYFGEANSSNILEKVVDNAWSEIKGSVKATILKQGTYKGNFEFTYGLVDSIE